MSFNSLMLFEGGRGPLLRKKFHIKQMKVSSFETREVNFYVYTKNDLRDYKGGFNPVPVLALVCLKSAYSSGKLCQDLGQEISFLSHLWAPLPSVGLLSLAVS